MAVRLCVIASIRKTPRRDGFNYQVRWRQDGRARSETFADPAQARMFRGLVDAAHQRSPQGWAQGRGFVQALDEVAGGVTLRQWFPQAIGARPRAPSDLKRRYLRMFENWVPDALTDKPMTAITEVEAGQWVSWLLTQGLSPKTAHNVFGTMSSVMKQAVRAEIVGRNVFVGLGAGLRDTAPERVFLEPSEFELVRRELPPHFAELATYLYWTGTRFGEATALQWRDIDLARNTVRVSRSWKRTVDNSYVLGGPKTRASVRTLVVRPEILAALRQRDPRERQQGRAIAVDFAQQLVFTHEGKRISQSVFYQVHWQPAVGRAQAQGMSKTPLVHDLRHAHASYLLDQGIDILNVSHRLGHSSVAVTGGIYGHRAAGADAKILAAMRDVSGV